MRVTYACSGIDADILISVYSYPADNPFCSGVDAAASSFHLEEGTYRPIYGFIVFCKFGPMNFEGDLAVATKQMLHILVRHHVLSYFDEEVYSKALVAPLYALPLSHLLWTSAPVHEQLP
jgi:hypothetical protein